jgi:hypothetical protein
MSSTVIERSVSLVQALDDLLGEPSFPHSARATTAAVLCNLGRQHHRAIVTLLESGLPASAAALLRVIFESHVRSAWLHDCATDDELADALKDRWPSFGTMIEEIEASPLGIGVLAAAKNSRWRTFNSFTHNGTAAFARQLSNGVIDQRFSAEGLADIAGFADSCALMIVQHMCVILQNTALAARVYEQAKRYVQLA